MCIYVFRKKSIIMVCLCCIVLSGIMFVPDISQVFLSGNRNLPVYSVDRYDNKIGLTFNCAWGDEDITTILNILDTYNVKSTFFIVGEWAEKYPESVLKIHKAGHEIGGHSYNHKDYTKMTENEISDDIKKNAYAIKKASGVDIKYIRVPSGAYNNNVISAIEQNGYIAVQWSVDSIDYGNAEVSDIYSRAINKTSSGDILLMHTGTANTSHALSKILDTLKREFDFLPISELLLKENFFVGNDGKMRYYKN